VEFDPVDECLLVYRAGVRGALTQRFAVWLAGSSNVLARDRRERDKLDGVDLDLPEADPIAPSGLDPRPLPQSDRERDVAGEDVVAQLGAELHTADASR
jgi:hypothetical protein